MTVNPLKLKIDESNFYYLENEKKISGKPMAKIINAAIASYKFGLRSMNTIINIVDVPEYMYMRRFDSEIDIDNLLKVINRSVVAVFVAVVIENKKASTIFICDYTNMSLICKSNLFSFHNHKTIEGMVKVFNAITRHELNDRIKWNPIPILLQGNESAREVYELVFIRKQKELDMRELLDASETGHDLYKVTVHYRPSSLPH